MQIIINNLDRTNPSGFVTTVHWSTSKTSGEHTASQYGTESFEATEGSFVPFDQLTQEMVTGWLKDRWGAEGLAAKEAALDAQLAVLANPPVVSGLPWASIEK